MAALISVVLTVLCKLIGFVREQTVAAVFGINVDLDTFYVALLLPTLCVSVILRNLATAMVLAVTREGTLHGPPASIRFYREALFWGWGLSLGMALAVALAGPALLSAIYPSLSPETAQRSTRLLWLLIPYSTLTGMADFWSLYLNSHGRYTATSLSAGVISISIMLALWLLPRLPPIESMIVGFTAGACFDLMNLALSMRAAGLPVLPSPSRWTAAQTSMISACLPLVIGSMLHFGTEMVDQSMASRLGEGSISELKYGNRIVAMVFGVLTIPLSQVVFPKLVQLVESRNWSELQRVTRQMAICLLAISIPITAALILFSQPIVAWSFERGKFTPESTMQVAAVQAMYAFQLPFYLVSLLLVRLAVSLRLNRLMLLGGGLNLVVNAAMNWVLMKPLGVTGIALATAIVYLASVAFLTWSIRQDLRIRIATSEPVT
jgi:putative peptidoglycan lipid II flippase